MHSIEMLNVICIYISGPEIQQGNSYFIFKFQEKKYRREIRNLYLYFRTRNTAEKFAIYF